MTRSLATDEPCTPVVCVSVSATMRLLRQANWWAPRPLPRPYARYGIREEIWAERAADPV
jgi:hypothetical protein